MDNEIINRINFSLQKCGISKTEFGNRIDMTYNGVLKMLTGKTQDIKVSVILKIAKALNTSVDYLLGISDNVSPQEPEKDKEQLLREIADLRYIVELQKIIITQKG